MSNDLRAPFPWFGGKSRVTAAVWQRFGPVRNYVEPFAGSLAVLLGRPTPPLVETVNDIDCYIANFWRAASRAPDEVAYWADGPVNEADLHARHRWLVATGRERVDKLRTDPDFYDAQVAGWWVWGQCLWIGSGWCKPIGVQHSNGTRRTLDWAQRPDLLSSGGRGEANAMRLRAGRGGGRAGVLSDDVLEKRPALTTGNGQGIGVHKLWEKRPELKRGGKGVHRTVQQIPDLSGESGATGRGIHSKQFWDGRANAGRNARGLQCDFNAGGIQGYMERLFERLRRVRVCCGDWARVTGPAVTTCIGTTGVFLDPPYADPGVGRSRVYNHDDADIFAAVHAWAVENGGNSQLRIALCGYEGAHTFPEGWSELAWRSSGGYSRSVRGVKNRGRERIWFSPHCLNTEQSEFDLTAP